MRIVLSILASIVLLSACAETRYAGERLSGTASREAKLSEYKLKYIFDPNRRIVEAPPQPIQPGYCYRNFGDVVCYKDPLPNARSRLVGYQEPLVREPYDAEYKPIEYRDGDRSRVYNPYRNDTGRIEVYDPKYNTVTGSGPYGKSSATYPHSKSRGAPVSYEPVSRSNIYTIDNVQPVTVREFHDVSEPGEQCPKSCHSAKKASGKKSVAKKSGKAGKAKASKSGKKTAAMKTSAKSAGKPADKSASKSSGEKSDTSGSAAKKEGATESKASAMTDGEALKLADQQKKKPETVSEAVKASPPPEAAPAPATAPAPAPVAAAEPAKAPPPHKLEEIKYDKDAADPKDLIKKKQ